MISYGAGLTSIASTLLCVRVRRRIPVISKGVAEVGPHASLRSQNTCFLWTSRRCRGRLLIVVYIVADALKDCLGSQLLVRRKWLSARHDPRCIFQFGWSLKVEAQVFLEPSADMACTPARKTANMTFGLTRSGMPGLIYAARTENAQEPEDRLTCFHCSPLC